MNKCEASTDWGWLIIVATMIVVFVLGKVSAIFALISIILGALIALVVFAIAESILVLIDIERNTRTNTKK